MQFAILACAAFAGSVVASPRPTKFLPRDSNSTGPCAVVSSSASAALAASPTDIPIIDAQLGFDCLNSVSLHVPEALDLVNAILPIVQWQTDLSYLKDPPPGYLEPAVDILAQFNVVLSNISNNIYTNEYDFQSSMWKVINSAHDGHFRFAPDLLTEAISFGRTVGLVSVSLDGRQSPKVYSFDDILMSLNSSFVPSALTTVDGENVYEFLEALVQLGVLQDPDGGYNTIFFSPAFGAEAPGWQGYFGGSGRYGFIYPGATTTIGYENGTVTTYENFARVIGNFTGVTDGESFFQKFCTGPPPLPPSPPPSNSTSPNATTTTSISTPTSTGTPTPTIAPGYPTPVVISSDLIVSGYYLPDSDVAVLSMLTFDPIVPLEFQTVVQTFLADAKADGKTRLVIDLSANGGGLILQGYDTFRQLFPQIIQDGFTRFRDQEGLLLIAEQFSSLIPPGFDPETSSDANLINIYESLPNFRFDYNFTDQPFPTFEAKFGPHEFNGDNFTSIIRWDLDDPLLTINDTFGMGEEITGYGNRTNFTQPFAAEDIIMLYDGYCASTCTLFSEFMRIQAGVKSIFIGGRPTPDGHGKIPITQAIGGVKGANNYGYGFINELASIAFDSGTPEQQAQANWTLLQALTNTLANNRSSDNSINVRDNILRFNLADGTPAQFIFEPADCRIFYTPPMMAGPTAIWQAAAEAAWGSGGCVAGSLPGGTGKPLAKREGGVKGREVQRRTTVVEIGEEPVRDQAWFARHGTKVPV